jgi:hypothetical protein
MGINIGSIMNLNPPTLKGGFYLERYLLIMGQRIIRLTEADLRNIVRKVIVEKFKISKDERIKLTDNENFSLVLPLTTEAACKYGANTKWCVSGQENNKFTSYQKMCHTVGMVIIKDPKIQEVLNGSKFALNVWHKYIEFYDVLNRPINRQKLVELSKEYNFTDDLRDVIRDFIDYHNSICDNKIGEDYLLKLFSSVNL